MSSKKTWVGISFPFRIGIKGGIELSKADLYDITHIEESLTQILNTDINSRVMEGYFGSNISKSIFEVNEEATHTLLKYEIVETIKMFEPRVLVSENSIKITSEEDKLFVDIDFQLVEFKGRTYSTRIQLKYGGGM